MAISRKNPKNPNLSAGRGPLLPSRLSSSGIGAVCAAVLSLALFVFDAPAGAGPGSYHTVAGSGAQYEPAGCGQWNPPTVCGAAYGDTLTINASDNAGAHGSMQLNEVNIALTCVTIVHAKSGHTVYASGTGTDGKPYFATVNVPIAAGTFIIGNHRGSLPCGGSYWGTEGYGTFTVIAHP